MYFPSILIAAFAARALGEKAPSLPQLDAVKDDIAPAVADDALVLRGRSAYPKAAMVASEGWEDAATASEATNLASDEVMADETAGTLAGLRGAVGDEIQVGSGKGQYGLVTDGSAICPDGFAVPQDECKAAAIALAHEEYPDDLVLTRLVVGSWNYLPCGCSLWTWPDPLRTVPHYNTLTSGCSGSPSANRGLVCKKQLEVWQYKPISMKASVQREVIHRMTPGGLDHWTAQETQKTQHRTTRKQLYEETKKHSVSVSNTIEASMEVGASFPVKAVSVSAKASTGFSRTVQTGVVNSSTKIDEYEKETISEVTQVMTQTYTANPAGGKVKLVFKEVWKLGDTIFRIVYLNCDESESKKEGWAYEEIDVNMDVGVERQWYRIKNVFGYLHAGPNYNWIILAASQPHSYDQQWSLDHYGLISRSNKHAVSSAGVAQFEHWYTTNKGGRGYNYAWTGTQIKNGYGYCLDIQMEYWHWAGIISHVGSGWCGIDDKRNKWSFIPV